MERDIKLPDILKPEDYTYIGSYEANPWGSYFWSRWYVDDLGQATGLTTQSGGWCTFRGGRHVFYRTQATAGIAEILFQKIKERDTAYFVRLHELADKEFLAAVTFARRVSLKNEEATVETENLIEHGRRILFFWSLGWQVSMVLDSYLHQIAVERDIPPDAIGQYMPQPDIPLMAQQRDAVRLREMFISAGWQPGDLEGARTIISNQPELAAAIAEHLAQFGWIQNISWNGGRFTLEKLLDQLRHVSSVEKGEAANDSPFEDINDILLHGAYLNQAGSEYLSIFAETLRPFLLSIAERAGITYDGLQLLHPDELFVEGALASDLKDKIERRKGNNWCSYTDADNSAKIVDDPDLLQALEREFLPQDNVEKSSELVGQCAHKGKVTGRACIVISSDDFHKLKEGDVLITPMTTPDFVLIMQKSSAIVTDMGGMLSHAAIVSRELDKPCIVGTKAATKTFKDGDLVEVDADNGVVRILESHA